MNTWKISKLVWYIFIVLVLLALGSSLSSAQSAEPDEEQIIGAEAIERRTAHSRHYYLGDRHYQAEIYSEPIHYLDHQGDWQPIDEAVQEILDGSIELPFGTTDTYISTGDSTPKGNQQIMFVGRENSLNVFRTLMSRSGFSDLPNYSMIDDDSNDVQIKLYLQNAWNGTTGWGSGDDVYVSIFEMNNLWQEPTATWNNRFTSAPWITPGGDYIGGILNELASTQVGDTWGYHSWSYFRLRDLFSLWKTYLSEPNFGDNGKLPYGILFQLRYESDTSLLEAKQFASEEYPGTALDPKLVINYIDGPLALSNTAPVHRRVPSPDYYSTPGYNLWQFVAVRVEDSTTANYDLELYDSSNYSSMRAKSDYPANNVDIIAIDQLVPDQAHYPFVYSENGGVGYYRIEYQQRMEYWAAGVNPGDTSGPYTMEDTDLIHSFTFWGRNIPCIHINPTSGNARLGAAIFQSGGGNGGYYSRDQALIQTIASTGGEALKICPKLTTVGTHALVIWNDSRSPGTTDTSYMIEIGDFETYLPLVIK